MIITGIAYKAGDNVDTDVIIPARYLNLVEPRDLAPHAMEDYDPQFAQKHHDIIVAGANFGCGSSREHAPLALKAAGVKAIIAQSFARIFFRNAINIGLPVIISEIASKDIESGEKVEIDLEKGEVRYRNKSVPIPKYSRKIMEIVDAGGLVAYYKKTHKKL